MLPGMFVLEYKSCCQFQCACQRSKTSTQPDGDDRKHTDTVWVNGEGSSLERRLEKRVCLCIKGARVHALMWFQLCRTGCRGYLSVRAHISPTVHSVVYPSVNMSRVWSITSTEEKLYFINFAQLKSCASLVFRCACSHVLCPQTCLCEDVCRRVCLQARRVSLTVFVCAVVYVV